MSLNGTKQETSARQPRHEAWYDAILVVSFGGPERLDDVMPFLENVTRGRPIPRERLLEVAGHYEHLGSVSPINAQNRALIAALETRLRESAIDLPVYWGNRNWHPFLADTVRRMAADGVRRALAFITSAYSSYSGCRQYLEDIARARAEVGPGAPAIDKIPPFYGQSGFIAANADRLRAALAEVPPSRRDDAAVAFTAHSIPLAMARASRYEAQLQQTCARVADAVGVRHWTLAYQSRSGPPHQPWLEPDILDHLDALHAGGTRDVVVMPVGFVSDHMEVLFDLDTEARDRAGALGMTMVRAGTVGTHPAFVDMIRDIVAERLRGGPPPPCADDCCSMSRE